MAGQNEMLIDWSTRDGGKYVTAVKNQEKGPNCMAYAYLSVFESKYAIKYPNEPQLNLSIQPFIDKGLYWGSYHLFCPYSTSVENYPLRENLAKGTFDRTKFNTPLAGFYLEPPMNADDEIMTKELIKGALYASVYACDQFVNYKKGEIYEGPAPPDGEVTDHAIVITDKGVTPEGVTFWNCKNSWGTGWGDNGYVKIRAGDSEQSVYGYAGIRMDVVPVTIMEWTQTKLKSVCDWTLKRAEDEEKKLELQGASGSGNIADGDSEEDE